jgi:lipid A 3-O-deacylase
LEIPWLDGWKETKLNQIGKLLLLLVVGGAIVASAESPNPASSDEKTPPENPVAAVRNARSWEYGPFLNWGTGVGDRADYKFLMGGFQLGKPISPVIHAGVLSGQFELSGNVMPLWQAYTPAPHNQTFFYPCTGGSGTCSYVAPEGGGTYYGASITPVIFRWNFLTKSPRFQPWFQGAGGLIYTTHKFPPDQLVPHGTPGATSVWNFSPQGGFGLHYFVKPKRSIDLGVNAVHISSASLGDKNPGVNASIQIQVGYTYWK